MKIWLDELTCFGYEETVDECRHSNWGLVNCQHKEDAGCICRPIHDGVETSSDTSRRPGSAAGQTQTIPGESLMTIGNMFLKIKMT